MKGSWIKNAVNPAHNLILVWGTFKKKNSGFYLLPDRHRPGKKALQTQGTPYHLCAVHMYAEHILPSLLCLPVTAAHYIIVTY